MPRDLYEIARECAEDVVSTAQCAGYEISGKRGVFFRSDLGNLADTITDWLQAHMELEPEPGLPSVDVKRDGADQNGLVLGPFRNADPTQWTVLSKAP